MHPNDNTCMVCSAILTFTMSDFREGRKQQQFSLKVSFFATLKHNATTFRFIHSKDGFSKANF